MPMSRPATCYVVNKQDDTITRALGEFSLPVDTQAEVWIEVEIP